MKAAKRDLAKLLTLAATGVLGLAVAIEAYILLFPSVTAPYGIGAGIFAIGVVAWLIWLVTRMASYLLSGDGEA